MDFGANVHTEKGIPIATVESNKTRKHERNTR